MAKHWRAVKNEIEEEIDRIWWEEPEEVTMSRLGIFPSGAGTDGQVLGNLLFLVSDTQAMGWWTIEPAIRSAIADPVFTLEHCKRMWKYLTVHMAKLLGNTAPPQCPAPWLNLPKLTELCNDLVDSLDTVETKEEFGDLIWSWENYVNRLNKWFSLVFPWHLGLDLPRRGRKAIDEMDRLSRIWEER